MLKIWLSKKCPSNALLSRSSGVCISSTGCNDTTSENMNLISRYASRKAVTAIWIRAALANDSSRDGVRHRFSLSLLIVLDALGCVKHTDWFAAAFGCFVSVLTNSLIRTIGKWRDFNYLHLLVGITRVFTVVSLIHVVYLSPMPYRETWLIVLHITTAHLWLFLSDFSSFSRPICNLPICNNSKICSKMHSEYGCVPGKPKPSWKWRKTHDTSAFVVWLFLVRPLRGQNERSQESACQIYPQTNQWSQNRFEKWSRYRKKAVRDVRDEICSILTTNTKSV